MNSNTLYFNGNIYTMESIGKKVSAIGCSDGKIVYAGNNYDTVIPYFQNKCDLKNKTVLPGFIDSHIHLGASIIRSNSLDFQNVNTVDDILQICSDASSSQVKGRFLYAINYNENNLKNKDIKLNREVLSRIEIPIIVNSQCLHKYILNDAALKILMPIIHEKKIESRIMSSGIFTDVDTILLQPLLSEIYDETEKKSLIIKNMIKKLNEAGITAVNTYESVNWAYSEEIDMYSLLSDKGELNIDMTINTNDINHLDDYGKNIDPNISRGCFKIFVDGSLGSRTAALSRSYNDSENEYGQLWNDKDHLKKICKTVKTKGYKIAFHAIGDKGVEIALDIIEELRLIHSRIIHAQILRTDLIEKMAKLPVYVDLQPHFIDSDMDIAEARLGRSRLKTSYCFKSLLDKGLHLTGGSDWPADTFSPMKGVYSAVTQKSEKNKSWNQKQRLSTYDALSLYTKNAARSIEGFHNKGILAVDKDADMIILDKDPFKVENTLLKDIVICGTISRGICVNGY